MTSTSVHHAQAAFTIKKYGLCFPAFFHKIRNEDCDSLVIYAPEITEFILLQTSPHTPANSERNSDIKTNIRLQKEMPAAVLLLPPEIPQSVDIYPPEIQRENPKFFLL